MANNIEPWRSIFKVLIIVCFMFFSAINTSSYGSREIKFKWNVEYIFWAPDCIEHSLMGINGKFPGPTISARAGDTIVVELTNKLHTEGLVIHWHGISQFGTPWADGTASISQCAINPGETFVYRFKVDKPGTYIYHGHYGMQRSAGLYGSLIVDMAEGEKEPFHYDGELNLLLSDWWHKSVLEQEIGLSSKPFRWVDEPQVKSKGMHDINLNRNGDDPNLTMSRCKSTKESLLINGKGQYNCSLAAVSPFPQCTFTGQEQCSHQILHVIPRKTYRLRIASITTLVSLNLAIGKHKMVVVEADGNYVEPFTVDNLDIHSGESYSVLITADQNPMENYWISVGVRGRKVGTPQALTVLNYHAENYSLPKSPPPITPKWDDFAHMKNFTKSIMALMDYSPNPPANYDRRIVLLNTQNYINGFIKWAINNISLLLPPTPYLGSIKYGLTHAFDQTKPPENFPNDYDVMKPPKNPNSTHGNGVYFLSLGTTIDVVLQNANALKENESEIHPWHLHGHDLWVLGYGEGRFSEKDMANFNLKNPPLRNTAVVFPYGWTALRFVANNPGVWAFHCHIEPHLHMGMGMVFAEGVRDLPEIPHQALACGLTAKWFMSGNHT